MFDFGLRLRKLREDKKLSQEALSRKLKISKSVISGYENNVKMPSLNTLINLALIFNVSTDYLIGLDNKETICIDHLTNNQRQVILDLIHEYTLRHAQMSHLTEAQQKIISDIIATFYYINNGK